MKNEDARCFHLSSSQPLIAPFNRRRGVSQWNWQIRLAGDMCIQSVVDNRHSALNQRCSSQFFLKKMSKLVVIRTKLVGQITTYNKIEETKKHEQKVFSWCTADSIEWFIEDQAFSRYDLAPHHPPPPVSKLDRQCGDTQEDWERETTCWRNRVGGRGAKSYEPARSLHGPLYIIPYSNTGTVWYVTYTSRSLYYLSESFWEYERRNRLLRYLQFSCKQKIIRAHT
jgi:hypothetical protein